MAVQLYIFVISIGIILLVHECAVETAVELRLNTTFYAQHRTLKSVFENSQSVLSGK